MKRIALALGFLFLLSYLHADEFRSWRSTEIRGAQPGNRISSGSIIIHDVQVTSGTGVGSNLTISVSTDSFGVGRSSYTPFDTSTTGDRVELDAEVATDWYVAASGNSTVLIRWNWKRGIPPGHAADGEKNRGLW